MVSSPAGLSMTTTKPSSKTMLSRSALTGKLCHDLRAKPDQGFGRCLHLEAAAAAAEDDPVPAHHASVDVQRHARRQRKGSDAADLHSRQSHHLVRRSE